MSPILKWTSDPINNPIWEKPWNVIEQLHGSSWVILRTSDPWNCILEWETTHHKTVRHESWNWPQIRENFVQVCSFNAILKWVTLNESLVTESSKSAWRFVMSPNCYWTSDPCNLNKSKKNLNRFVVSPRENGTSDPNKPYLASC